MVRIFSYCRSLAEEVAIRFHLHWSGMEMGNK